MKKILFTLVSASLMVACSSSKSSLSKAESTISENSKLSAVLWQQTSAEYEALCYQAFNAATYRMETTNIDDSDGNIQKMAIVMDLDETVINNSPYNGWLIENNQEYSESSWREWTNSSKAELIPGAREFIVAAQNKGFKIVFISNRSIEELEPTVINLNNSGVEVDISDFLLKTGSSSKTDRRQKVLAQFKIFMLIGDNLADFNDAFDMELNIFERKELVAKYSGRFGSRFIVLPNVMYGNWENALKQKRNDASIQNDNAYGLRKYIKTF